MPGTTTFSISLIFFTVAISIYLPAGCIYVVGEGGGGVRVDTHLHRSLIVLSSQEESVAFETHWYSVALWCQQYQSIWNVRDREGFLQSKVFAKRGYSCMTGRFSIWSWDESRVFFRGCLHDLAWLALDWVSIAKLSSEVVCTTWPGLRWIEYLSPRGAKGSFARPW